MKISQRHFRRIWSRQFLRYLYQDLLKSAPRCNESELTCTKWQEACARSKSASSHNNFRCSSLFSIVCNKYATSIAPATRKKTNGSWEIRSLALVMQNDHDISRRGQLMPIEKCRQPCKTTVSSFEPFKGVPNFTKYCACHEDEHDELRQHLSLWHILTRAAKYCACHTREGPMSCTCHKTEFWLSNLMRLMRLPHKTM